MKNRRSDFYEGNIVECFKKTDMGFENDVDWILFKDLQFPCKIVSVCNTYLSSHTLLVGEKLYTVHLVCVARAVTISFREDCNEYCGEFSVRHLVVHTVLSAVTLPKPLLWSTQWPFGSSSQICFSLLCFITALWLPVTSYPGNKAFDGTRTHKERKESKICLVIMNFISLNAKCITALICVLVLEGEEGVVCSHRLWVEMGWQVFFHSSVQKRLIACYCWPPVQLCVLHSRSCEA